MVKYLWVILLLNIAGCSDDLSEVERIKNAETYYVKGEYRAAIIELKKLLQINNKNRDSRYLLGKIYLLLGDGASAEKEFKRAKDLGIDNVDMVVLTGKALLLQHKYQDVLDLLQLNMGLNNIDKASILMLRGDTLLGMNNLYKAHDAFDAAAALDPSLSAPLVGNARVSVRQGKLDDASAYLDKAEKITANDKEVLIVRAEISKLKGDFQQAEWILNQILKEDKARNITEYKFRVLTELVVVQIMQGKLDAASIDIKTLAASFPRHPYVRYLQGWLAFQKQNYEMANTELLELQKQAPDFQPGLLLLGASNFALGNYEQANIYLTRFVHNAPTHIQARKLLGVIRIRLNQPEKAIEVLQADVETTDTELIMMAGQAAAASGNFDKHLKFLKQLVKKAPDNLVLRTELAKAYMKQGAINEAITELELIQRKDSKDQKTELLLVYARLRAGDIKNARNLAQKLLDKTKSEPNLHALMGGIELIAGRRILARMHYQNALKLQKDHLPSLLSLARMDLEDGNLTDAAKKFDQVLISNDSSVAAMLGHAQIAGQRGEVENLLSWLQKARAADSKAILPRIILARYYLSAGNAESALEFAQEVNDIQPDSVNSLVLLGRIYLLANQPQNALSTYQKLVRKMPSDSRSYTELAVAQFASGELNSARASLMKSLQLNSKNLKAKVILYSVELKEKHYSKAINLAVDMQRQHVDKVIGYRLEGDVRMLKKQYRLAQASFKKANEIEPSVQSIIKLSQSYFVSGDANKSLLILNKGLVADPDNVGLRIALATQYQQQGNIRTAERHYKKVLEQQPSNIVVLNNMATLLTDKNPEKALSYARQAYQLAPQSMAVTDTLGWLLINQAQLKEGLEVLTQAIAQGDNPTVKYHLAYALTKNGKKEEARAILGDLVESGIEFPERLQASKLLAIVK